ncbi:DGQHR domain-containing protein [Pseudomonas kuykendallii]|uniref:DGQHR domain-containing protein n=1 Tax=Pseudomonas kuykendallii TaxID=1007099 RepID=A0A1H3DKQ7_9PSED|nr:DGQHR domain-containing protein [Pseudomonas kuykendallii]MCQ4270241.1 DGQHR domain-containing protein [Pseudomonas kuykendallii]SDX67083.1 DGQHR domain-containing protein [Pseudomonas kuykendallii]
MRQRDLVDEAYYGRQLEIRCLKVHQPMGEFYVGCINSKDLREITYSDVRRMEGERGFESYLGIQRPLNSKRVKEISAYTKTVDACFPTAVLLSVKGHCAEFDEEKGILTLMPYRNEGEDDLFESVPYPRLANVIDGQHRIAGLHDYAGDDFEINVSIFVEIDVSSEAYLFSTVNLAQTKVSTSLVYDLYDLANKRSPQKLCHEIAVALDKDKDSPFFRRIKRLGGAQPHNLPGSLTQAAFVQALMRYISSDPMRDRDAYMRGRIPSIHDGDPYKQIFRKFLIEDRDYELTDIIWDYFKAVESRWPRAWSNPDKGIILSKTNGFMALMRLLKDIYLWLKKDKPTQADFDPIFARVSFDDSHFSTETYKPGTSGESALYKALVAEIRVS